MEIIASIVNLVLWCFLGVYLAKIKISEKQTIIIMLIVIAMEFTMLFGGGFSVYN